MFQSSDTTSDDVTELLSDICRQAGLKLTRQRVEVLRELTCSADEPSVDKIHARLQSKLPTLSRETVRRTLGSLERFGIIQPIHCDEVVRPRARVSSGRPSPAHLGWRK